MNQAAAVHSDEAGATTSTRGHEPATRSAARERRRLRHDVAIVQAELQRLRRQLTIADHCRPRPHLTADGP